MLRWPKLTLTGTVRSRSGKWIRPIRTLLSGKGTDLGWRVGIPALFQILFALFSSVPIVAFVIQLEEFGGRIVPIHWTSGEVSSGVPFIVDVDGFPFSEEATERIVRESFETWSEVETSRVTFSDGGRGQFRVSSTDRRNVIFFDQTGRDVGAPPGSGVIAVTRLNWNSSGEIIDSDIVFNGRDFKFSTATSAFGRNEVDLEGVLIHEIGHFLGLDHSPLEGSTAIRPTMYPFFFGGERSLSFDDMAGVSSLYPSSRALDTGSITGNVAFQSGRGAFGVHVVAYRAGTTEFVVGALSGASGDQRGDGGDGAYEISGLPPGSYQVTIEPLRGTVTSNNFGGIFSRGLDTDFSREFYDNVARQDLGQIIQVNAGRIVEGIDFTLGTAVAGSPFFESAELPVNTPDTSGPYRLQVHIGDDIGVTEAEISYQVDAGVVNRLALQRDRGDLFFVDIPGQAAGAIITYRVLARDADGHETALPAEEIDPLRFEVLELSGEPILYVATRRTRELSVIDTGPNLEIARIPTGESPLSVLLTPDERYLFVANSGTQANGASNQVTVVETATHRVAAAIDVGRAPLDLAISPDGRRVYVTNSQSRSVSVLDVDRLEEIHRFPVLSTRDGPFGVVASPDNRFIYVTDIDNNQVIVMEAGSGRIEAQIGVIASPRSLAISASGSRLYASGFDGGISVVDTKGRSVIGTIDTGSSSVFRIVLSPDGKRLYATDRLGANLLVVDLEQNSVVGTIPALSFGRETRDLAVSADGSRVYVTNQDSDDLVAFDTASFGIVKTWKVGSGPRGIAILSGRQTSGNSVLSDADFDRSGRVDFIDFLMFAIAFGTSSAESDYDPRYDLTGDDAVNFGDFVVFAGAFGKDPNP